VTATHIIASWAIVDVGAFFCHLTRPHSAGVGSNLITTVALAREVIERNAIGLWQIHTGAMVTTFAMVAIFDVDAWGRKSEGTI
jgi:hypothetical protein